jgi:hypothetical protein
MPAEAMLRSICCGDSSNRKYRHFSPRAQAAFTKCAESVVLPVPAVPVKSTVLAR